MRLGQQDAIPRLRCLLVVPHAGRDHLELRESLPSGPSATATLQPYLEFGVRSQDGGDHTGGGARSAAGGGGGGG